MKRSLLGKTGLAAGYAITIVVMLSCIFPLVWMFLASFKTKAEVLATPLRMLPGQWQPSNFISVFRNPQNPLGNAMAVTFLVSASAVVLALLFNTMAGYVFARIELRFKKIIWNYCIFSMYIPGMTILITSFLVVNALGMLNSFAVLLLPGLIGGYSIFFFRQFFLNMPSSLEDAARIDGCGCFRIYWNIFLPLSATPLIVSGAGCFLGYWNSFLWPSITITDRRLQQVMPIIRSFQTAYGTEYGRIMAAGTIAVLPPIILFAIFQKYLVKGVILSGLK